MEEKASPLLLYVGIDRQRLGKPVFLIVVVQMFLPGEEKKKNLLCTMPSCLYAKCSLCASFLGCGRSQNLDILVYSIFWILNVHLFP
jgi:hypothetical protein